MNKLTKPCESCPWRVDATVRDISSFDIALAESLAATCHPSVQLAAAVKGLDASALKPGADGPSLHSDYQQILDKLRATCAAG